MPSELEVCNLGLGKLGGAGEALNGNAFLTNLNGSDKVSQWCKFALPRMRKRVIKDLATLKCPFRSTIRFKDLGSALSADALPEIGQYQYAFNIPGDYLELVMQFNENYMQKRQASKGSQSTLSPIIYQCEVIANKAGTGKILLTDTLSNYGGTSAFIEYVIDTPSVGGWSEEMINCVATLLASEVAPVLGKDIETAERLLERYLRVTVPAAQRANQTGFNATSRSIPDLSGGRSSGGFGVNLARDLGSYKGADGLWHDI